MGKDSITHRLKIAGFLLNIAEWDRHIEVTRQILNGIPEFEPYEAFLRMTLNKPAEGLSAKTVEGFLSENSQEAGSRDVEAVTRLYDTKFKGHLDFEDFLKVTLARDNPKSRFEAAAKRAIKEVPEGGKLSEEIEYCLSRLFSKACEFVKKLNEEAESQTILRDKDLFMELCPFGKSLDFKTLKRFFETLKIVPKDSELISILRFIDINDDGIIDKLEFDYFMGLFSSAGIDSTLLEKLKQKSQKENKFNYFGEPQKKESSPSKLRENRTTGRRTDYASKYSTQGKIIL